MDTTDTQAGFVHAPTTLAEEVSAVVEQQKLGVGVTQYIVALATHHPFTKDIVVDRRRVMSDLAPSWPVLSGQDDNAREVLSYIDEMVRLFPAVEATPNFLLRISVNSLHLTPLTVPEPDEPVSIVTFDAATGIMRTAVLPSTSHLPELDYMSVEGGIMVLCQPLPPLINAFHDSIPLAHNALINLYAPRNTDKAISGDEYFDTQFAVPVPLTDQRIEEQKRKTFAETRITQERVEKSLLSGFGLTTAVGALAIGATINHQKAFKSLPVLPTQLPANAMTANQRNSIVPAGTGHLFRQACWISCPAQQFKF